eukprot:16201926-Heterocapsa_arctica.AAC.1
MAREQSGAGADDLRGCGTRGHKVPGWGGRGKAGGTRRGGQAEGGGKRARQERQGGAGAEGREKTREGSRGKAARGPPGPRGRE